MNGCVKGFRVKEALCVLFAFVCVTILFWAQERPLLLSSILPSQFRHFSPEQDFSSQVNRDEVRHFPPDITAVPSAFQTRAPSSDNITLSKRNRDNRNVKPRNNQGCNYFQGKWIVDDTRPLYSGSKCTRWLSGMWACRLNHRLDFSYEKLRWKPKDCDIDFTASDFLTRMQDKTVAFIGDSLARQQFQSLMCMATEGEDRPDVQDVGKEYGLIKARHAKRPDGWAYRFLTTNTTIIYYWSASLSYLEPLNPSLKTSDIAMHLDRPPAFLSKFLHKINVLVLNTGHHWNLDKFKANRWIMYLKGKPNDDEKIGTDIQAAKNYTIHTIIHWMNSQLPNHPTLKVFYRTISPRHFINGDWNSNGTCDNTTPSLKEVSQDELNDPFPFSAVKGTNVTLLDITSISKVRDDAHVSKFGIRPSPGMQDCLHWCLPGVPDTWNEVLFAHI